MDVCMRLFCVCVVLCVDSGLATGWSLVQGVLPTVYRIKKLKKRPKSNGPPPTSAWRHRGHGKHSLLYCCLLDRVYRAVAWQRVDEIRYNRFRKFQYSHLVESSPQS
jgi:hypothetical protein